MQLLGKPREDKPIADETKIDVTEAPVAAGDNPRVPGLILVLAFVLLVVGVYAFTQFPETPLKKAADLIRANKAAAALPILEDIARKEPESHTYLPLLALCYLDCDRLAEGRTAINTALEVKLPCPETVPVLLAFARYYQGRGDFREAENVFAAAQLTCPSAEVQMARANMYLGWAEFAATTANLSEAIRLLKIAREQAGERDVPEFKAIPQRLADLYRQLAARAETLDHNDAKALALLEESLQECDEPATRMALGNIYMRLERLDRAVENFQKVCQEDGNNLEARHKLVDLLVRANRFEEAQKALSELCERERSVENCDLLADLNLKLANYAGAVRALEDANNMRPNELPMLLRLQQAMSLWRAELLKQSRAEEALSVKVRLDRLSELIKTLEENNKQNIPAGSASASTNSATAPPFSLASSRISLAKGSFTPEGELRIKGISAESVSELPISVMFYDKTTRRQLGTVTVSAASATHPLRPGEGRSLYFSSPTTVRRDHHLCVIILWKGRLLRELPVVKER